MSNILLAGALLITVSLVAILIATMRGTSNYGFTYGLVSALSSKLLTYADYEGLIEARGVEEVVSSLSDYPELKEFLTDTVAKLNEIVDRGGHVLIEGTQGTFLSLYHGTYPYVTSRDVTVCGILSEVGIGPRKVTDIVLVFKAYWTRVGAGELPGELSPEEAAKRGWIEYGTVTGRPRRVAPFNIEWAKRAVMINTPTQIAITKIDALFPEARGKRRWEDLPVEARKWIENIENELKVPVTLIGTGEEAEDMVDRRRDVLGPL